MTTTSPLPKRLRLPPPLRLPFEHKVFNLRLIVRYATNVELVDREHRDGDPHRLSWSQGNQARPTTETRASEKGALGEILFRPDIDPGLMLPAFLFEVRHIARMLAEDTALTEADRNGLLALEDVRALLAAGALSRPFAVAAASWVARSDAARAAMAAKENGVVTPGGPAPDVSDGPDRTEPAGAR